MKLKIIYCALLSTAISGSAFAQTKKTTSTSNKTNTNKTVAAPAFSLKTSNDSLSYALGIDIAKKLKEAEFNVNPDVFHKAVVATLKEEQLLLTDEQNMDIIQNEMRKAYEKKTLELKKPGEEFLAKNRTRPEVKVTAEGVQYEILQEGDGAQATVDSEVEVHYKGTLIDGTQFDSSYDRNESLTLQLDRVIEGWKIGIPLMKVGSKYKFYIPYNLAYGERATGSIPAYSALIFEVELLGIK